MRTYHITDYFLYQPDMPGDSRLFVESPARYTMHFEDVWIHTKDRVKIHGYLIQQNRLSNRNVPTIIFFHGNAGNIGHRLENVKLFYYQLNCNVLMVEYRGYGRSEGAPSEKGLYADAQAAFEYIDSREDLDSKKIILFGRSLGGAVAIDLAARCDFRDRVAALIVENTFTSIPAIAKELFKFAILKWVPNFCYKNRFESLQKIGSVACPTLFISGTNDELLPPSMTNELYSKCAAGVKLLHRFPGGHNDTWICKDYIPKIAEFIEEEVVAGKRKSTTKYQAYSDNIV
ncbi:Alpha/beta hydrolase domain-containing protein 13 [Orchesella cincta]|uniref:Protein ABHD13 n=1 Tax=Orchesella cincta TaxID=48709 RepID=A0A1D2N2U1_ORCCI|nr:Alpha/beta hydrolase domain-containing protein 13 [Orchesella cincta]